MEQQAIVYTKYIHILILLHKFASRTSWWWLVCAHNATALFFQESQSGDFFYFNLCILSCGFTKPGIILPVGPWIPLLNILLYFILWYKMFLHITCWQDPWRFSSLQFMYTLTHWGRVTHICVGKLTIIGSDNGLSPGRRQAIIWTNAGIWSMGPLGTNYSEILIEIHRF